MLAPAVSTKKGASGWASGCVVASPRPTARSMPGSALVSQRSRADSQLSLQRFDRTRQGVAPSAIRLHPRQPHSGKGDEDLGESKLQIRAGTGLFEQGRQALHIQPQGLALELVNNIDEPVLFEI